MMETSIAHNGWRGIEERVITVFKEKIKLMDDMAESAIQNYHPKKIHPFRELCLGYLVIANNNSKAALRLIEDNFVHQVHYISRNMFEMITTLYCIDDDKSKKDDLIERYFKYNASIVPYKAMRTMKRYPRAFEGIRTDEMDEEIMNARTDFKKTYGEKIQTWSGKSTPEMIEDIKNLEIRNDLMKRYCIMVQANNNFLHPTRQYIITAIKDFTSKNTDHKVRVMQLHSVSISADLIIRKFLDNFPKGRPVFRKRLSEISENNNNIMESVRAISET